MLGNMHGHGTGHDPPARDPPRINGPPTRAGPITTAGSGCHDPPAPAPAPQFYSRLHGPIATAGPGHHGTDCALDRHRHRLPPGPTTAAWTGTDCQHGRQDRRDPLPCRTRPGENQARWPYASFDMAGSNFRHSEIDFQIFQNDNEDVQNDPPPIHLISELRPMLATRWAPSSVTGRDSLHVPPDGDASNPERFSQALLIRGFELARSDEQDQLQPSLITHPAAFRVVDQATQQKRLQLFLTIKGWQLSCFGWHDSSVSFLTYITQVLDIAKPDLCTIECLISISSLDKSNDAAIIVARKHFTWGRKASTDGEGDKGPSDSKPNDPDGRGFESHLLHWKRRFGNIGHEASAGCQGDLEMARRNKIIQYQNGQEFDEFTVNGHSEETRGSINTLPTVTVQLFNSERLPVGYLILDRETAESLGRQVYTAAVMSSSFEKEGTDE